MLLRLTLLLALCPAFATAAQSVHLSEIIDSRRKPQSRVYRRVAGRPLRLFFYAPSPRKQGERPSAIVFIHGGGWGSGFPELMAAQARYFARRGAVAILIEYRLIKKTNDITIFDCMDDARAALRWVRAHAAELDIHPHRVVVAGDSAGGHLAAVTGVMPNDSDKAVSAQPDAMILFNPGLDLLHVEWCLRVPGIRGTQVSPEDAQHPARRASPMYHIRPNLPPTLVVHGTEDSCLPHNHSEKFVQRMKKAGNDCELLTLPGVKHAFIIPGYGTDETFVKATRAMDKWLVTHGLLTGEPILVRRNDEPPAGKPRQWFSKREDAETTRPKD